MEAPSSQLIPASRVSFPSQQVDHATNDAHLQNNADTCRCRFIARTADLSALCDFHDIPLKKFISIIGHHRRIA